MLITIFTPTYNRAYILPKLYESLCVQSNADFEWIVVDDGSTDETEQQFCTYQAEGKIKLRYIKVPNAGKHLAINRGLKEAVGELFFIVDSDDHLPHDALQNIAEVYEAVQNDESFAGICGVKLLPTGKRVGGEMPFQAADCTSLEFRIRYNVAGDMAEVWRTDILRQYPFPTFEGEKFCPEALVWNRIAQKYKLRYFNKGIYVCDYLPDGLTAKTVHIRMQSCRASMLYYSELASYNIPMMQKMKAAVNYWRFAACSTTVSLAEKVKQIGVLSLFFYPFGFLMHLKDKKQV